MGNQLVSHPQLAARCNCRRSLKRGGGGFAKNCGMENETMKRMTSSINHHWHMWGLIGIILLNSSAAFAQNSNNEVFAPIPETQRSRLIERLTLLIEYQKTQQWAMQYGLLSSLMTRAERKRDFINRTRQAYSKWGRTPLLAFTPYKVSLVQVDANQKVWFISGCSKVLEKGQKVNKAAVVEVYKEKNDWFFSEVQNIGTGEGDDPCLHAPANNSLNPTPR
ncbi:MAG TPA: hypothetical protein VMZ30_04005 [Pyrinomonadaceae bacterium]|nr:hypothetical protein [Pyrinomonadaceae bacterium]